MTPFRGVSMDPGTACEIGFAYALGKPVVGYVSAERNMRDYRSRMSLSLPDGDILERDINDVGHEVFIAPDGMSVEDFGLNDNLMMSAGLSGLFIGPAQALTRLKEILEDRTVHPRACGVHRRGSSKPWPSLGPSPCMRGTLFLEPTENTGFYRPCIFHQQI